MAVLLRQPITHRIAHEKVSREGCSTFGFASACTSTHARWFATRPAGAACPHGPTSRLRPKSIQSRAYRLPMSGATSTNGKTKGCVQNHTACSSTAHSQHQNRIFTAPLLQDKSNCSNGRRKTGIEAGKRFDKRPTNRIQGIGQFFTIFGSKRVY